MGSLKDRSLVQCCLIYRPGSLSKVFLASGFATAGYADDNSGAYAFAHNSQYDVFINQIPDCLSRIKSWMDLYYLKLNETKTEIIVFGGKNFLKEKLCINGTFLNSGSCLRFTDTVKYQSNRCVLRQLYNI